MGKELSLLATISILLLFLLLAAPIYLSYQAATDLPRITHMHQAPNGHLFILLGEELYEYDSSLNHYKTIDLGKLGGHHRLF